MRGYAVAEVFSANAILDMERAARMVDRFPEKDGEGRLIRCHEAVRAVHPYLSVEWVRFDGLFLQCQHSWLMDKDGQILDVYSVGRLPVVQLVDAVLYRSHYCPKSERTDIREDVVRLLDDRLSPFFKLTARK